MNDVSRLTPNGPWKCETIPETTTTNAPAAEGVAAQGDDNVTTGTGTRIRIRGSNSVSLSNEPLLIIDGVRVDLGQGTHEGHR